MSHRKVISHAVEFLDAYFDAQHTFSSLWKADGARLWRQGIKYAPMDRGNNPKQY